jgi:DNA-directed RNA polymerase sigma subunit (sigma70/sigma32)
MGLDTRKQGILNRKRNVSMLIDKDDKKISYEEIAKKHGITAERVRQIVCKLRMEIGNKQEEK